MEVVSLNPIDAAYIAGLVDGEGTITLIRKHCNENRQLLVSISNTEKELLEFVLQTVGAGKITGKRTAQPHHPKLRLCHIQPASTKAAGTTQSLSQII